MEDAAVAAVHDELVKARAFAPLELGGAEELSWLDCDLACLAENRLGEVFDPRELDEARRADWRRRATVQRMWSPRSRSEYERCYWLVEDGERQGTIALANSTFGSRHLRLASFYAFPSLRGCGRGTGVLRRLKAVLARHGLGFSLETDWCWQRTVRFYVRAGLWIRAWKRDLSFCWEPETPDPLVEVGERTASLSVANGDQRLVLARAERRGDALVLERPSKEVARVTPMGEACWHAGSTLALALALNGWPLIRSREDWDRCWFCDASLPESLAYKITVWEAWAVRHGWKVETPRIAGLVYPTWGEFESEE